MLLCDLEPHLSMQHGDILLTEVDGFKNKRSHIYILAVNEVHHKSWLRSRIEAFCTIGLNQEHFPTGQTA